MVTEANWHNWEPADFKPYMETVLEAFGTDRIMIGSDWSVCTVAAKYEQVIEIAEDFIQQLSPDEQQEIWSDNPKRIYSLDI
jgi:L-fuconolactonase